MKLTGITINGKQMSLEQFAENMAANKIKLDEILTESNEVMAQHKIFDLVKNRIAISKFELYNYLSKNHRALRGKDDNGDFGYRVKLK